METPAENERVERAKRRLLRHEAALIQEEQLRKQIESQKLPHPASFEVELTKIPRPGEWIVPIPQKSFISERRQNPLSPPSVKPFPKLPPTTSVVEANTTSLAESSLLPDESGIVPVAFKPKKKGRAESRQTVDDDSRILTDSILNDDNVSIDGLSDISSNPPDDTNSPKLKRNVSFIPFRKQKFVQQVPFKLTTNIREIMDSPLRSHLFAGVPIRNQSSLGFLPPEIESKINKEPLRSQSALGDYSRSGNSFNDTVYENPLVQSSLSLQTTASLVGASIERNEELPQVLSPSKYRLALDSRGLPAPFDHGKPIPFGFYPLEEFDDAEMEKYSPEEWIAHAGPDGLRAYSKYFRVDGSWTWEACRVLGYDRKERHFLIEWEISKKLKNVARLNLIFKDEDKERFLKRLQAAINHRFAVEAEVRYRYRLDRLPVDERHNISDVQVQNIIERIGFPIGDMEGNVQLLFDEVLLDYRRTYLKFEFDMKLPPQESIPVVTGLLLNQLRPKSASPLLEDGMFSVGKYPFKARLHEIQRILLVGNHRIHEALIIINEQLQNLMELEILPECYMISPVEYESLQLFRVRKIFSEIRQILQANIIGIITACYVEEGNTKEDERYIRFIKMINQLLQSLLRVKLLETLNTFANQFHKYLATERIAKEPQLITSTTAVYFRLKITLDEGKLRYDPPISFVIETVKKLADEVVQLSQKIPFMNCPSLKFDIEFPRFMKICNPDEKDITVPLEKLSMAINELVVSPNELITYFPEYEKLLGINPEKYTVTMSGEGKTLANFQSEVKKFRLLIESVKENLADDISINIFAIDILGFQSRIIETSQLLKKICVDCVHRISVEQMTVIKDKLDSALARIKQIPSTPDELANIRDVMRETQDDEDTVQLTICSIMEKFAFLEELQFDYSTVFPSLWHMYGMPRIIKLALTDAEKILQTEKIRMIRELRMNQKSLDTKMFELAKAVETIQAMSDINASDAVGDKVRFIRSELDQVERDFNRYTHYETLFGFEKTENPVLKNSLKVFDPYVYVYTY